jgi:hypothetical protein
LVISRVQVEYRKYDRSTKLLERLVDGGHRVRIKDNFRGDLSIIYHHAEGFPPLGTKNAGLAYGDLLGLITPCLRNPFTIAWNISSLGGAHRCGGERTGASSVNSIS